jgi:hypothetical protein
MSGLPPPAAHGREARRDNEYQRCGTANVFCWIEPKAGRHFTYVTPGRSGAEFAQVAFHLAMAYPQAKTIHWIVDNLNIHRLSGAVHVIGPAFSRNIHESFAGMAILSAISVRLDVHFGYSVWVAVGTAIADRRRVAPGNFTPRRSQNRA